MEVEGSLNFPACSMNPLGQTFMQKFLEESIFGDEVRCINALSTQRVRVFDS